VSTVTSVGNFLPANIATSGIQYHPVTVDVVYNLKDAAGGTIAPLMAIGRIVTNIGLEAENVALRAADRFPLSTKNIATSSVATDRTVCGARYYEFELSDVNSVGGLYKSTAVGGTRLLPLNNTNGGGWSITPGVSGTGALAQNTIYMTRIRPYFAAVAGGYAAGGWGTTLNDITKIKTLGVAGMPTIEDEGVIAERSFNGVTTSIYPNPNNGSSVNLNVDGMEGELQVRITDATGRMVYSNRYIVEGAINTTMDFGQTLAGGVYMVEMVQNGQLNTMRMVVNR